MTLSIRSHLRVRRRLAAGALVALMALGAAAPSPVQAQTAEKLERAKKKLERIKDQLTDARQRLDAARADLDAILERVSLATSQVEGIRAAVDDVRRAVKRGGRKIDRLQGRLNERARDAYIDGPASGLQLVLEADSLTDLSDRVTFLEVLARDDADVATGIEVERDQLKRHRGDLRALLREQERLLASLEEEQRELEAAQERAAATEAEVADKLAEARETVKRLERKQRREYLASLRAAGLTGGGGTAGPPLSADGPLYYCPVDPPRSYTDTFGAPRSGGRSHQGNDIFAPTGTPIRAPFDGVARESWNSLGGYSVHVYADANGDYVYNAHLSRYAGVNGARVTAGTIIGYVGNTGNAVGTPPHDHFEYHPGGGSAVTPYPYLNEVCGVNGHG
jgi:murein DD-endopeptidase MepM/ murein hydrolase activator NlpD